MKTYAVEKQKGCYGTAAAPGANYLVCATGMKIAETETLAAAIETAKRHIATASELRVHEFASGQTWYLE